MTETLSTNHLLDQEHINVMVVGSGGREQALAWKLSQSPRIGNLSVVRSSDALSIASDPEHKVDLAVIGPDDDLANGLVDQLQSLGIPAFGPSQRAAQIESSKPYAKKLMQDSDVPTASFEVFTKPEDAFAYVEANPRPLYIKAGGLAVGRGALGCLTPEAARSAIHQIMVVRKFGPAGDSVVIEEFLDGQEVSLHAICDGDTYRMFPSSQDHKKADEGDKGPNTGGMGTISPVPWFNHEAVEAAGLLTVRPILSAMGERGDRFSGVLYPGLMAKDGLVKVLEFNARFGDPETQVYMRQLESDLLEAIVATVTHNLDRINLEWSDGYAVCVVAASGGYPGNYEQGKVITGIEKANALDGVKVFLAGATEQDGKYYTSGGRVLSVTATGQTLDAACNSAYAAMDEIQFEDKKVRYDIGYKALHKS